MAVNVKRIVLWRADVENKPGVLATTLEPFAACGADLQVVMVYRFPGNENRGAIELYPVAGRRSAAAAQAGGLSASAIPTVLVDGDNRPGLGHAVAKAIADAGINLIFLMAQVLGRRYSAVMGFESEADSKKAAALIKKATTPKKRK